ncbi:Iron(III) dicitrate-binding periplasmic protein (plasmid) [Agrobacterium fabrum]|nr:Iron(III) dicitrate-binding periplasmic protein [Agrobacterium tumefaciens]MDH6297918.1 iron complex transport system substrate-binding protein [Agrobacterium fabrum]NMV72996.1 iron-siderophore ABC transporter substrate-binding protein [Agrobacterium fabrum]QQN09377.1 iron-siderophore ABC transporter substrate-binding protein [Agrobacterium fabrum]QQN14076.1 iron-siderophore ABC transporter substrate-binding protein [Agrobacterium fabrum]
MFSPLKIAILLSAVLLLIGGPVRSEDGFPRTVQHALGKTAIPSDPERIVTLGWSGEDAVLALGKTPVGMPRYRFFESGIFPWNEQRLDAIRPYLFEGDIDYEAIAALRPDLILGIYSGVDDLAYKRLSSIAPTVVYRSAPWSADWKEQTEMVGQALGRSDEAKALIEKTASTLKAMGDSWPVLRGKTFTFGTYFPGGSGLVVYLPEDPRVAALLELGLKPSAGVLSLSAAKPGQGSVTVGMEQVDSLDADILIMWYGEGARIAAEAQPLFMRLPAIKHSRYVALEDPVSVWSTSALSVLSIPYGFPRFLPRLAAVAERAGKE